MIALVSTLGCSGDDQPTPDRGVDLAVGDRGTGESSAPRDARPDGGDLGKRDALKQDLSLASAWKPQAVSVSEAIHAVWGISAQNVFAVGKKGTILHNDGKGWTTMLNPEAGDLYAVYALSPQEVYAAGDGVVVYYDGIEWKKGYTSTSSFNFRGLWAAGGSKTMYGVGEMGGYIRYKTGTPTAYWSTVYLSGYGSMYGIWGVSDTEIYVVGEKGLILKCSGDCTKTASWTKQTSGVSSDLRSIWGVSSADLFAVGLDGTILHYNGTAWSVMDSKSVSYFYGVWGSSGKDVFTVGHPIFKQDESIMHYDGSAWSKLSPAAAPALSAVWGTSATNVYAVGAGGIILHYDGTKP